MKRIPYRMYLTEDQLPKAWYNLRADMADKPDPKGDAAAAAAAAAAAGMGGGMY